jgi:hypothetical protein
MKLWIIWLKDRQGLLEVDHFSPNREKLSQDHLTLSFLTVRCIAMQILHTRVSFLPSINSPFRRSDDDTQKSFSILSTTRQSKTFSFIPDIWFKIFFLVQDLSLFNGSLVCRGSWQKMTEVISNLRRANKGLGKSSRVARFFGSKHTKTGNICQMTTNYIKLYLIAARYSQYSQNIPTFSIPRPSKIYPDWDFWY